jgi:hypothetical protein
MGLKRLRRPTSGDGAPLLPARKYLIFSRLRRAVPCKILIINGLRPKYSKQMGYGCNPLIKRVGPGDFPGPSSLFFISISSIANGAELKCHTHVIDWR